MKIGVKFNLLTEQEYVRIIGNHQKYTDFNTLGLYRSILENDKLDLDAKIAIRALAHEQFIKSFEFLQLKDPDTYIKVSTLGETLTIADKRQLWENVRTNQEKILKDKRIKHRNFGIYSKHDCGYADCFYNGIMIHRGSRIAESNMHFDSDNHSWSKQLKSDRQQIEKRKIRASQTALKAEIEIDRELEELS
jgi:hypothetical protein